MDKKNTILLTVIAVATLLVAIVGATFAYYSVQAENKSTNVNVNVNASQIGVLTLSTPEKQLYMNVTPTDMADYQVDKSYYATNTNNVDDNTSNKKDSVSNFVISKLEVQGGNPNTSYTCKAKLKITLDTKTESMGKVLKTGDVKLHLNGENVTINGLNGNEVDLFEILGSNDVTEESKVKEYEVTYKIDGKTNTSAEIKADVELINKTAKDVDAQSSDQSYLAGKNLNVTFEIVTDGNNLDCSIDPLNV